MKKLILFLIVVLLVFGGIFMWLLRQSGPEYANTEIMTTELPDNFEK